MRFVLILLRYVCPRALISKACFAFKIDKEKCSPKGFSAYNPRFPFLPWQGRFKFWQKLEQERSWILSQLRPRESRINPLSPGLRRCPTIDGVGRASLH